MQWCHQVHLSHRYRLQKLEWLWLPSQDVVEVEEVMVYQGVVVVKVSSVTNVDWELTRDSVCQWIDMDVNVCGCEV